MNKLFDVAVVGATGLVGQNILSQLVQKKFPIGKLILFAGPSSAGKRISFGQNELEVLALSGESVIKNRADIAFFCAGGEVSRLYAPLFSALGCIVIDNSSAFRLDESVPLVIPEVNPHSIALNNGIIANPNCSTIIALRAVAPLHKKYGVKRLVFSTYQAVSGAGQKGIDALKQRTATTFGTQICENIIPQIGGINENGYTVEEQKMMDECKKILGDSDLCVTATAVRVPVYYGHSISINAELKTSVSLDDCINSIKASGVIVSDLVTPKDCEFKDDVYACRLRKDPSQANTFNLMAIADNVLKGAALNAVQIAQRLV